MKKTIKKILLIAGGSILVLSRFHGAGIPFFVWLHPEITELEKEI